jgi:plasmid stabilization system protein ParE
MSEYFLTPGAEEDVSDILAFVGEDSVDAMWRLKADFGAAFERLAEYPRAGHTRADLATRDVRFWIVHSYVVIYRAEATPIEILRVLSGYRDISDVLAWGVSEAAELETAYTDAPLEGMLTTGP